MNKYAEWIPLSNGIEMYVHTVNSRMNKQETHKAEISDITQKQVWVDWYQGLQEIPKKKPNYIEALSSDTERLYWVLF